MVDRICNSYLGGQTLEIDASPFLLLLYDGLIVLKNIGPETGEQGLTFVGSVIMVSVLFGRDFFRGVKWTKL